MTNVNVVVKEWGGHIVVMHIEDFGLQHLVKTYQFIILFAVIVEENVNVINSFEDIYVP